MFDIDSNPTTNTISSSRAAVDQGLRDFMLGVYNNMTLGLAVTALTALGVNLLVTANSGLASLLYASPLAYVIMFAPLAFVLLLSFGMHRMSVESARLAFYSFAAVMGLSLSSILLVFTGESIVRALAVTTIAFGGLSLWAYTTRKDISAWGSFLIMGVIGVVAAAIINVFLASSALSFAISIVALVAFSGLTAWDTQRLKSMYLFGNLDREQAARVSIMGALSLYLNFINIFTSLLNLMGSRDE